MSVPGVRFMPKNLFRLNPIAWMKSKLLKTQPISIDAGRDLEAKRVRGFGWNTYGLNGGRRLSPLKRDPTMREAADIMADDDQT